MMNASRTSFRCCSLLTSFRWIIFVSSALYFLYFTQLLVVSNYKQLLMTASSNNNVKIDRSRCCVRPSPMVSIKDVCGRVNCTEDCPDPVRLPIDTGRENAFFLETSGSGKLTIRQACSVESLAYHNPNLNVNVLFMMEHDEQIEKINNRSKGIETIEKLHEKYKNIQMMLVSLDEFIAGTALEKWYHCTDWRKGPYHVSHLSDGLRFLTLNKFGGYYFDLDVLIVKSVMMYRNFIARESNYNLASNSIHADLGNPVIEMAVKNFVSNYRCR